MIKTGDKFELKNKVLTYHSNCVDRTHKVNMDNYSSVVLNAILTIGNKVDKNTWELNVDGTITKNKTRDGYVKGLIKKTNCSKNEYEIMFVSHHYGKSVNSEKLYDVVFSGRSNSKLCCNKLMINLEGRMDGDKDTEGNNNGIYSESNNMLVFTKIN